MKSIYSKYCPSFILALGLLGAGCKSAPPPPAAWNLTLKKSTPASVDVDIVGVSPTDEPQLMNMKPDDWWAVPPNDTTRRGYKDMMISTNFQNGDTWIVAQTDPIWKKWFGLGVTEIMVIADLPRMHDNTPNDSRRKFLKLNKETWKDAPNQTIEIVVQDDRVRVITPMQMEK